MRWPDDVGGCHSRAVPDDFFGEDVAARYDQSSSAMFAPEALRPVVDALAELAGEGAALELAVGTGRVALPLAARGVAVSGIELSTAMASRLRAKDGGHRISVTIGDMASTRVEGAFRLVYLVYNTIGDLTTQDQQVACFANAAPTSRPVARARLMSRAGRRSGPGSPGAGSRDRGPTGGGGRRADEG